jgi:hypothetical protein
LEDKWELAEVCKLGCTDLLMSGGIAHCRGWWLKEAGALGVRRGGRRRTKGDKQGLQGMQNATWFHCEMGFDAENKWLYEGLNKHFGRNPSGRGCL